MTGTVIFDPLLAWPLTCLASGLVMVYVALAYMRGLPGWWLRGLAGLLLLLALVNPLLQREERNQLSDIVILVVDASASQGVSDRPEQVDRTIAAIESEIERLGDTELRVVTVGDGEDNQGTLLMTALSEAIVEEPQSRACWGFSVVRWIAARSRPFSGHERASASPDDRAKGGLGPTSPSDERSSFRNSWRASDSTVADRGSG